MAVTAAFALAASLPHANAVLDFRVIRPAPGAALPRFVRLRYDVTVNGLRGTQETLVDTVTGRYAERTEAGPLSSGDGYDGIRTWVADANGLAQVEDHPEERAMSLAWGALIARPPDAPRQLAALPARRRERMFSIRYSGWAQGFVAAVGVPDGRVTRALFATAGETTTIRFPAYARHGPLLVPSRMLLSSRLLTSDARLRAVETPGAVPDDRFVPPAAPDDASLDGVETVPIVATADGATVRVRIDDGPPLRMLFDTGSSLALSPAAARRSGLRLAGHGRAGGIGPGTVPERYAVARRVRIGRAELRDQALEVFPQTGCACDGLIGIELIARFAVRFDFMHSRLTLARDPALLRPRGVRQRITLESGQPEVDGAVDRLRGRITLDTGSVIALDVTSPAVRRHRLIQRYHATVRDDGAGVGGTLKTYLARVRTVRLGTVTLHDVEVNLDDSTAGSMNDPSVIGNAGLMILARFVMVLDVPHRTLYLQPLW
jgi:hypothetical protein